MSSGPRESSFAAVTTAAVSSRDRKSTRLNSSHLVISYAVFCLKKKKKSGGQTEWLSGRQFDTQCRRSPGLPGRACLRDTSFVSLHHQRGPTGLVQQLRRAQC